MGRVTITARPATTQAACGGGTANRVSVGAVATRGVHGVLTNRVDLVVVLPHVEDNQGDGSQAGAHQRELRGRRGKVRVRGLARRAVDLRRSRTLSPRPPREVYRCRLVSRNALPRGRGRVVWGVGERQGEARRVPTIGTRALQSASRPAAVRRRHPWGSRRCRPWGQPRRALLRCQS